MVFRGVLYFEVQKGFLGVCSKRVSGCVVLEAFSSRARFICTTVVQIGVARIPSWKSECFRRVFKIPIGYVSLYTRRKMYLGARENLEENVVFMVTCSE